MEIFIAKLDSTGRTTLPPDLRNLYVLLQTDPNDLPPILPKVFPITQQNNRVVVTASVPRECEGKYYNGLSIFPYPDWQIYKKSIESMRCGKAKKENIKRCLLDPASELVMDKRGRILIPEYLLNIGSLHLGQKFNVVSLAQGQCFELWNMDSWAIVEHIFKCREQNL